MEITMDLIKTLRDKTGAGMLDCKLALVESGGEIEQATEILRKKGITRAAKRSNREAKQGIILVDINQEKNKGYILEINSETDFVARNEQFRDFAELVQNIIIANNIKNNDFEELLKIKLSDCMASLAASTPLNANETVKDRLDNLSGTYGEKLEIKKFESLSGQTVSAYSHGGGKIGVLVALDKGEEDGLALDIAMQIASMNPKYKYKEDVPPEERDKEKEIYLEQLAKENKPDNIKEKIIDGKMEKYYQEVCLAEQEYIKDETKRVKDILGEIKVADFIRLSL